jgi:hypothetical protein
MAAETKSPPKLSLDWAAVLLALATAFAVKLGLVPAIPW